MAPAKVRCFSVVKTEFKQHLVDQREVMYFVLGYGSRNTHAFVPVVSAQNLIFFGMFHKVKHQGRIACGEPKTLVMHIKNHLNCEHALDGTNCKTLKPIFATHILVRFFAGYIFWWGRLGMQFVLSTILMNPIRIRVATYKTHHHCFFKVSTHCALVFDQWEWRTRGHGDFHGLCSIPLAFWFH